MIFVAGNYIITTKEFMLIQNHTINQKIDILQEACIFFFRLAEFFGKFLSWISLNLSTPVAPVVFLGFCSDAFVYLLMKDLKIRLGEKIIFSKSI